MLDAAGAELAAMRYMPHGVAAERETRRADEGAAMPQIGRSERPTAA